MRQFGLFYFLVLFSIEHSVFADEPRGFIDLANQEYWDIAKNKGGNKTALSPEKAKTGYPGLFIKGVEAFPVYDVETGRMVSVFDQLDVIHPTMVLEVPAEKNGLFSRPKDRGAIVILQAYKVNADGSRTPKEVFAHLPDRRTLLAVKDVYNDESLTGKFIQIGEKGAYAHGRGDRPTTFLTRNAGASPTSPSKIVTFQPEDGFQFQVTGSFINERDEDPRFHKYTRYYQGELKYIDEKGVTQVKSATVPYEDLSWYQSPKTSNWDQPRALPMPSAPSVPTATAPGCDCVSDDSLKLNEITAAYDLEVEAFFDDPKNPIGKCYKTTVITTEQKEAAITDPKVKEELEKEYRHRIAQKTKLQNSWKSLGNTDQYPELSIAGRKVTAAEMAAADSLARTAFGEFRREVSTVHEKFPNVAMKVAINRAIAAKSKIDNHQNPRYLQGFNNYSSLRGKNINYYIPHIVTADWQFSPWNREDDNLAQVLCPGMQSQEEAWHTIRKYALQAVLNPDAEFVPEIDESITHFTSKVTRGWPETMTQVKIPSINGDPISYNSDQLILWSEEAKTSWLFDIDLPDDFTRHFRSSAVPFIDKHVSRLD